MIAWLLCSMGSQAQKKKNNKPSAVQKTKLTKKPLSKKAVSLVSIDSNAAKASAVNFRISDPVINAFKLRASGNDFYISGSGVPGVPKGAYGVANGKLSFYATGATSSGTSTGSGSVGTGTSPGAVGSLGPAMGVNGKSIYAGWGPYGTRVITKDILTDTTRKF